MNNSKNIPNPSGIFESLPIVIHFAGSYRPVFLPKHHRLTVILSLVLYGFKISYPKIRN